MSILITGVAGFIGCHLAKSLVNSGNTVLGVDNLSRGSIENLASINKHPNFRFKEVDVNDVDTLHHFVLKEHGSEPISEVWHLAANSDIPAGIENAQIDLRDTFMTTFNTLRVMKNLGVKKILFASSSAIYGNLGAQALTETTGPLMPISNYGAMKLASEAIISAATESDLDHAYIFRFPNVIGIPATHGVIRDFCLKLKIDASILNVLGNGTQQKGYLHVSELIDAMLYVREHSKERLNLFNLGTDDSGVTVRYIAEKTVEIVSPGATINFGSQDRGWVGDVPRFSYNIDRLRKLGWKPKLSSRQAIDQAIAEIACQEQTSS